MYETSVTSSYIVGWNGTTMTKLPTLTDLRQISEVSTACGTNDPKDFRSITAFWLGTWRGARPLIRSHGDVHWIWSVTWMIMWHCQGIHLSRNLMLWASCLGTAISQALRLSSSRKTFCRLCFMDKHTVHSKDSNLYCRVIRLKPSCWRGTASSIRQCVGGMAFGLCGLANVYFGTTGKPFDTLLGRQEITGAVLLMQVAIQIKALWVLKGGDFNIEALVALFDGKTLHFFFGWFVWKNSFSSLCPRKSKPPDQTKPWSLGAKVGVTSSLPSRSWWRFTGAELGFFHKKWWVFLKDFL